MHIEYFYDEHIDIRRVDGEYFFYLNANIYRHIFVNNKKKTADGSQL